MHNNIMIPVQIKKVRDPDGKETLKATVPMNLMFEKDFDAKWLEEELSKFELNYLTLVNHLKDILKSLRATDQKEGRVLSYWRFGDKIIEFLEQNKNNPLFLENVTKSLMRDSGVSDRIVQRCRRLRLLYPDSTMIDSTRSFDSYVSTFEGGYISKSRQHKET